MPLAAPANRSSSRLACGACGTRIGGISFDRRRVAVADRVVLRREPDTRVTYLICPECGDLFYLHGTVAVFVTVEDRR